MTTTKSDPTDDETEPTKAAIYARVSTSDQDNESQIEVCTQHAKHHRDIDEWEVFSDVQSGHDDDRPQYVAMKHLIADGRFDYFVCSEFSRISRNDSEVQSFVADCFNREMGFEVVQSSFSVAPSADPIDRQAKKMLADILANLSTMENLQKIDRINRGIKHAREVGKWTRKPPAGFEVDPETQFLKVDVGEFLEIRDVLLDHYYNGTTWAELEHRTPVTRSTLSAIYNDEDRRRLYIHGEGWDKWDRDEIAVQNAEVPDDAFPHQEAALEDADLKTYLQIADSPERIDPEAERERKRRKGAMDGDEMVMLRTMQDVMERTQDAEESLSDDELRELLEQNREEMMPGADD